MSKRTWSVVALLVLLACRGEEPSEQTADPMASMGEMDHSQHGGGAPDVRQAVHLTPDQERALGVSYLTVARQDLTRTIRTVGRIEARESGWEDVTPKVAGFVERLWVATTGEPVRRGQPLLGLYSPELVTAQEELLTARRLRDRVGTSASEAAAQAQALVDAARRRLLYWDISEAQIQALEETGAVTKTLALVAPVDGVVLEKPVIEGQRVEPGQLLYRVADLSEVWVEGEVFERDLQLVREGMQAHIEVSAYPGEHRMGNVSFVYPTVDAIARTNAVRVTLPNRDLRLKPGMFATVFFDASLGDDQIVVPVSAVIVTGERSLVFVHEASGMLTPREVVLGAQADPLVQVLSGLTEGEEIVSSANFLIDAESRLGATGGSMPGMQHGADPAPMAPAADTGHTHD
ncbi:MAG: efflux RND transporter periplasmic adaptor subunit [Gemmatimonadota bacterium]